MQNVPCLHTSYANLNCLVNLKCYFTLPRLLPLPNLPRNLQKHIPPRRHQQFFIVQQIFRAHRFEIRVIWLLLTLVLFFRGMLPMILN